MKNEQKSKKPATKKPAKPPKDLSLKARVDKADLKKVVGAGGTMWTG